MAETLVEKLTKTPEGMRDFQREHLILEVTEAIAEAMEEQDIDRSELARRLGKTRGYITQLLAGTANMTLKTVADVFTAMGRYIRVQHAPIEQLLGKQPSMKFSMTLSKDQVAVNNWPAQPSPPETTQQANRKTNSPLIAA
jgi:transcriptional regulator with XRE-family HTH domain